MELKGSRLLVIGGAGFIGSHLVDQLTHEDVKEICVFDDFSRGRREHLSLALRDARVRLVEPQGSILHTDVLHRAMEGMDGVFHLAALWLLHCQDFPRSAFEVNVAGTFNVLEACLSNRVKRLIFSSSASVYGNALSSPMTEEHPFDNRTFYGATKIAGEQMCRAFHHRYGLNYAALRYMNVYGPRQDGRGAYTSVIMSVLEKIGRGEPPVIHGDGSQSYDFIHVEDVARANVLAMKSEAQDEAFNIGMGTGTSIRELVQLLLTLSRSSLEPVYKPQTQVLVTHRLGSTEKAERLLGFKAGIELEEGLQSVLAWRARLAQTLGGRSGAGADSAAQLRY